MQYGDRLSLQNDYSPPVAIPPYKKLKYTGSDDVIEKAESQHAIKCEPSSDHDVLSFLKNRPQLAKMQKNTAKVDPQPKPEKPRTMNGKEATDIVDIDHFKDHPAAWQQSETIESFLHRLPVQDPATSMVGPWLWVGRPTVPYAHSRRKLGNSDIFTDSGTELLQAFNLERGKIESENVGKASSTITRKLTPHREQLESDLLTLAVKMAMTSGKWMLFPDPHKVAHVWSIVATATANGKLGPTSKVSTPDPSEANTLICIYSYDFSDVEDVRRVLNEIVDLGLCHADGKPLYYKCDAYRHLNISSNNPYKLRASLYSSKDILKNEVKALEGGPVARMKKPSSRKMTDFYQAFAGDDIS